MQKKTVYRRPKPIQDFKKTFTVNRPIAKASTPALSKKITTAISPESILELNIKDELGEYQWLEEADFKTIYNKKGVLSMKMWMYGTAAYPDSLTRYAVVDLKTGNRVRIPDLFTDLTGLAAKIRKAQSAEVKKAIINIKSEPENGDADPELLFADANFTAKDLKDFSVDDKGVTFYYDYGFPHVIEAFQPVGEFSFTWIQLKPFIKQGDLLARFVR